VCCTRVLHCRRRRHGHGVALLLVKAPTVFRLKAHADDVRDDGGLGGCGGKVLPARGGAAFHIRLLHSFRQLVRSSFVAFSI
jgi:hypothetical protein